MGALVGSALAVPTHIVVNRTTAALSLPGWLAHFYNRTSTGRSGMPTPRGEFHVSERDAHHISTIYHCPMPYYLRLSGEPFGIHYGHNPGYPASHECIRVGKMRDAAFLFQVVTTGTAFM
jgi:lipoprotein-anchoring transpeptidase ErfK/SrfK